MYLFTHSYSVNINLGQTWVKAHCYGTTEGPGLTNQNPGNGFRCCFITDSCCWIKHENRQPAPTVLTKPSNKILGYIWITYNILSYWVCSWILARQLWHKRVFMEVDTHCHPHWMLTELHTCFTISLRGFIGRKPAKNRWDGETAGIMGTGSHERQHQDETWGDIYKIKQNVAYIYIYISIRIR